MTLHGVRLFPIGLVLSASVVTGAFVPGAIANAQVGAAASPQAKTASATDVAPAADAAAPAPAPVFPKRPVELPPKPPKVTCRGDQITISADNSTLDAILAAVKGCTGAKIEIPGDSSRVRAFEELGPGPVREVLDELLSGSPYNYVIQSSEANPQRVESVLLSMRTNDTDKPGAVSNSIAGDIQMTAGRRAWQKMQKFDKPDPSTLNEDGTQVEAEPSSPASEAAASTSQPLDSNQSPAGNSTDAGAAEAAAAATPPAPPAPAAPPVVDPNSNADPAKAMQDRISAMQQMFAQRQQMIQKQNQTPSSTPNN